MDALDEAKAMSPKLCVSFELPPGSPYGSGAEVLMKALAEQTSLVMARRISEEAAAAGHDVANA